MKKITSLQTDMPGNSLKLAQNRVGSVSCTEGGELHYLHECWQKTLDIGALIESFAAELVELIQFDSFEYYHSELNFKLHRGNSRAHRCQYSLLLEGKELGEMTITRRKRFFEREVVIFEKAMSTLVYSLRNALQHQTALDVAFSDSLTGMLNRNALEDRFPEEIERTRRYHSSLTVLLLDIDNFKQVNDTVGHGGGDKALKEIAKIIAQQGRAPDFSYRYGGDEFLFIMPNTSLEGAMLLGERIRRAVESLNFQHDGTSVELTISLGMAEFAGHQNHSDLIADADRALYVAKQEGRNCLRPLPERNVFAVN